MSTQTREWKRPELNAEHVAGGLVKGQAQAMDVVGDRMLRGASKAKRFVLKTVPGAPGFVYDVASLASAKDKPRKIAGLIGSGLGGAAGAGLGMLTGPGAPVASPAGAAAGSMAGEAAAEWLYDNRLNIKDWMEMRAATLAHDLSQDLERYAPVNRIRRAGARR